jgi:mercuric ion transport protein
LEFAESQSKVNLRYLVGAVLVSIGASVCCIGPFVLLATGISGAWMNQLMFLERYYPVFLVIVLSLFAVAWWKIFRPGEIVRSVEGIKNTESCSSARIKRKQKLAFYISAALAAVLLTSEYWIAVLA